MTIVTGDCRQLLKILPNNSADLVLTSPPYNMNLRISGGRYCSRQIIKDEFSTKYDEYADNLMPDDYFNLNRDVIDECLRVSGLVFYNVQFLTGSKRALFRLIGHYEKQLKDIIIWDKVNAQPAMRDKVLNSQYEVLMVFDRDNAIARRFEYAGFERGTLSNLWSVKREPQPIKGHGAAFPLALAEKVITNFCPAGGMVIDPFTGTGTTAIAAQRNGRKFLGFELSEKYAEAARARIKKELQQ